jgi:hypothetical protein
MILIYLGKDGVAFYIRPVVSVQPNKQKLGNLRTHALEWLLSEKAV